MQQQKKLFIVYLKFNLNLVFCILPDNPIFLVTHFPELTRERQEVPSQASGNSISVLRQCTESPRSAPCPLDGPVPCDSTTLSCQALKKRSMLPTQPPTHAGRSSPADIPTPPGSLMRKPHPSLQGWAPALCSVKSSSHQRKTESGLPDISPDFCSTHLWVSPSPLCKPEGRRCLCFISLLSAISIGPDTCRGFNVLAVCWLNKVA